LASFSLAVPGCPYKKNMKKTKIEWTDFSWNPVTGCLNDCPYCYARAIYKRFQYSFEPAFHPDRLNQPFKITNKMIFVCSVAELFGDWIDKKWIARIFEVARECPENIFQFLTKNPKRLIEFSPYPDNCWIGCTATNQTMANNALAYLDKIKAKIRFISFEPLLSGIDVEFKDKLEWIIIGACTGERSSQPGPGWVRALIDAAGKESIPIFMKPNLVWKDPPRDYPDFKFQGSLF